MDLIIFDLDGTLINSEAIILGAQYEAFRRCGRVHPGRNAGLGIVGLTLDIALAQLAGLDQPDDVLTQTYREVFGAMRLQAHLDFIVERHGWQGLFDTVQSADDAPSKPHPGMILNAMAETGATPGRTAMVGDSSFDIEMAVAAGAIPVAVSWGFQPVENLVALGARHRLTSITELPGTLGLAEPAAA